MLEKVLHYLVLMRFDKPIGIYLLLWPALWALWIASKGDPSTWITFVFVAGVVVMRAAGCIINDIADRNFDAHVSRTQYRPLASGMISVKAAAAWFVFLCLFAFLLVLTTNPLTIKLSFAAVVLAMIYPLMKRYTYMPQAFLGLAFGWAVPMAFAAVTEEVPLVAWLILTATVLWATAYDTMYAMVDRDDDIRIGIKSTAILFGDADRVIIGMIQVLFFASMWIAGNQLKLGLSYNVGLLGGVAFAVYQQFLIRHRERDDCLRAFQNNHLLGSVIFIGLVLEYWKGF